MTLGLLHACSWASLPAAGTTDIATDGATDGATTRTSGSAPRARRHSWHAEGARQAAWDPSPVWLGDAVNAAMAEPDLPESMRARLKSWSSADQTQALSMALALLKRLKPMLTLSDVEDGTGGLLTAAAGRAAVLWTCADAQRHWFRDMRHRDRDLESSAEAIRAAPAALTFLVGAIPLCRALIRGALVAPGDDHWSTASVAGLQLAAAPALALLQAVAEAAGAALLACRGARPDNASPTLRPLADRWRWTAADEQQRRLVQNLAGAMLPHVAFSSAILGACGGLMPLYHAALEQGSLTCSTVLAPPALRRLQRRVTAERQQQQQLLRLVLAADLARQLHEHPHVPLTSRPRRDSVVWCAGAHALLRPSTWLQAAVGILPWLVAGQLPRLCMPDPLGVASARRDPGDEGPRFDVIGAARHLPLALYAPLLFAATPFLSEQVRALGERWLDAPLAQLIARLAEWHRAPPPAAESTPSATLRQVRRAAPGGPDMEAGLGPLLPPRPDAS